METRKKKSTRSKTSENAIESSALPIPIDLIFDIFSRLPSKSIAVCRCVSKPWASTLRRQDFTDLYLTKSSNRPQILFARQKDGDFFFFSSPQPQNSSPPPPVSATTLTHLRDFTFVSSFKIRGLVHGLVCLVDQRISERKIDLVPVLYNPSTGQTFILPKVKTTRARVKCLLGYDPVDKQFKVLSMTKPMDGMEPSYDFVSEEHQVLTLGSGEMSWRMIQCRIPHLYPREAICINGVLYYTSLYRSSMIVCFDVRSEEFRLIEVQGSVGRGVLVGNMVNCNGRLGLIVSENNEGKVCMPSGRSVRFVLWVLEDVEKQEWSERVFVLPAEWKNVIGEHRLNFVGVVARTDEIVLSSLYTVNPFYLFYFNPERNTVVRVEVQGLDMGASKYGVLQTFLEHVEDVKLDAKVH